MIRAESPQSGGWHPTRPCSDVNGVVMTTGCCLQATERTTRIAQRYVPRIDAIAAIASAKACLANFTASRLETECRAHTFNQFYTRKRFGQQRIVSDVESAAE